MMSIIEVKEQATTLKDFLKQNNSEIKLASCLQAIAKINGFKDWNTMSAILNVYSGLIRTPISETFGQSFRL